MPPGADHWWHTAISGLFTVTSPEKLPDKSQAHLEAGVCSQIWNLMVQMFET